MSQNPFQFNQRLLQLFASQAHQPIQQEPPLKLPIRFQSLKMTSLSKDEPCTKNLSRSEAGRTSET